LVQFSHFFAVFPCNDPFGLDGHEWFLEEFQFSVMALAYAGFKKVTNLAKPSKAVLILKIRFH
jgi:hypothetical protein